MLVLKKLPLGLEGLFRGEQGRIISKSTPSFGQYSLYVSIACIHAYPVITNIHLKYILNLYVFLSLKPLELNGRFCGQRPQTYLPLRNIIHLRPHTHVHHHAAVPPTKCSCRVGRGGSHMTNYRAAPSESRRSSEESSLGHAFHADCR